MEARIRGRGRDVNWSHDTKINGKSWKVIVGLNNPDICGKCREGRRFRNKNDQIYSTKMGQNGDPLTDVFMTYLFRSSGRLLGYEHIYSRIQFSTQYGICYVGKCHRVGDRLDLITFPGPKHACGEV
jgi:hypothetical protein